MCLYIESHITIIGLVEKRPLVTLYKIVQYM